MTIFKDKKIGFIGTGISNNALIRQCVKQGNDVTIFSLKNEIPEEFSNIKQITGENYLDNLCNFDIVVRSPGVYFNNPKITEARRNGVIVTSETEIFFQFCPCKIIAITGSDGKTTTTNLIAEMLKSDGKQVFMGGNCGKELFSQLDDISENDFAVVELSSFQLLSMKYSPDIAVITNITPNHLDVHGTMEEYIEAKKNIFAHQNEFSKTVLNAENSVVNGFSKDLRGTPVHFSTKITPYNGAFLDENGDICYSTFGKKEKIMNKSQIKLPGFHNIENYLAAISAVYGLVSTESIIQVAENFAGVEHRIEYVREINGVKWYNDSIATSPTRVLAGLNSFESKLILIAGGYDKKIPFEPMAEKINEKVKYLILFGKTAEKIENSVKNAANYSEIIIQRVENLDEAVEKANDFAKKGDIVTLSPACAAFDMFKNFEERGNYFKFLVNKL
ncbi:MAG: UDP-N-acetylmuramoyl-L-alanine--D-glutamate ligase [Oscillospiraceae bacterium]|jgi:UDP-N-acetylmuramoylalanine--D-glutamate ligase|nr:UDP-N-acetylmuramoyl-L-alanine--D-glutamate ligase [Oscillospiraceae bacterium]